MIDFLLYKPNPNQVDSLRVTPKMKAFGKKSGKVEFFNANGDPILVHFLDPLRASQNPLKVHPGRSASVKIDPMIEGEFPCQVEILASQCPSCGAFQTGRKTLSLRPDPSLPLDGAAHACNCANDGVWKDDDADADPIIKINP
jgi:hypothetical protein